jgi:hypothetical protein
MVPPLYSSPFLHGAQPSYLIAIFGEGIEHKGRYATVTRYLSVLISIAQEFSFFVFDL